MKRTFLLFSLLLLLAGCGTVESNDLAVAATARPVYLFTAAVCQGTDLEVSYLIDPGASCLHDYSLSVTEMKAVELSRVIVLSGGGLEDFMADMLRSSQTTIDAGTGIELLEGHDEGEHGDHDHEDDPHYWMDPEIAAAMVQNIAAGLSGLYPQYADTFAANADDYCARLEELHDYGTALLADLACRDLVTFHDGFGYFAEAFDLEIVAAIEEESGSEASAADLKEIISIVEDGNISAIFVETNGSDAAASVISRETGAAIYTLDMLMSGDDDYFTAMKRNLDTIKEALG
jgi:ABC-type Zn uptake system ZnuABC Zn-binding protein ZnuA